MVKCDQFAGSGPGQSPRRLRLGRLSLWRQRRWHELLRFPFLVFSGEGERAACRNGTGFRDVLLSLALGCLLLLHAAPVLAADLQVSEVRLERCPADDVGSQPDLDRPAGASCYALRGVVLNAGKRAVIDTDVFAQILDASGEPVLPNRTRVGSIGDVPPGRSDFALRLAVPAGTPGPFSVRNAKARGFSAPVRTRVADGEERLPLEQQLALH